MKLEIKTKQHVHGKRVCAHFVDKLLEKRDSRKIASGMLGGVGWSEVFGIKDRTMSKNQPLVSERTEHAEEKKAKIDQFAADLALQPASGRGDRSSLYRWI